MERDEDKFVKCHAIDRIRKRRGRHFLFIVGRDGRPDSFKKVGTKNEVRMD